MVNIITTYLFHPIVIYTRIWRLIYYPLLYLFNLPTDNHNNYSNSHVLSLVYSIIMTMITPYTYYLIYNNYVLINQINANVVEFIYGISLSYFIADLYVGIQHYPIILNANILTSYVHHFAYISLFIYGKYYNKIHLFVFGLPYEIPTILLNLKYVNNKYYNNRLFGILFLFFRIFYNMYLSYKVFMVHNDLFIFSICTLILHMNWFVNYVKKYVL